MKNGNEEVTLVIPLRNEKKYIPSIIQTIEKQKFKNLELEIIFVDGYSTDDTYNELKRLSRSLTYKNKIIQNKKMTKPISLNMAIKEAKGNYIVIMDGHNFYPNNYLSRLIDLHKKYDCENVGGTIKTIPEHNSSILCNSIADAMESPFCVGNSKFRVEKTKNKIFFVDTVAFGCYKKSIFGKLGLFDEDLIRNQDDEFNARIISKGWKILCDSNLVVNYVARNNFIDLWKMFFQYGFYKPVAAFKLKRIYTFRQIVPLFSLLFGITLTLLSFIDQIFFNLFFILITCYCISSLVFSISAAMRNKNLEALNLFKYFLLFLFSSIIIHSSYALGYIKGLIVIIFKKQLPINIKLSR